MDSPMSRHTSFPSWGFNTAESWDTKMPASSRFSSYAKPLPQRQQTESDPFRFGDPIFMNWGRESFTSPMELNWPQTTPSGFSLGLQGPQRKDFSDGLHIHCQERDHAKRPVDIATGNMQQANRESPPPSTLPSNGPGAQPARAPKRHVKSACFNCKRAHLSCDVLRPCTRCVQTGKISGCVDVPQRRKGRPRLRQDSTRKSGRANITKQLSVRPLENAHEQRPYNPLQNFAYHTGFAMSTDICNVCSWIPLAFLTIDLRVVQSNSHFQTLFQIFGDLQGQTLEHLIERADFEVLQNLRCALAQDVDRELTLTSTPVRVLEMNDAAQLQHVESLDIPKITNPFTNRRETIRFRFADGSSRSLCVEFSLSKTDSLFVTLALPPVIQSPVVVPSSQPSQYGMSTMGSSSYLQQPFSQMRGYYGRDFERAPQLQLPSPDAYTQFPISPSSYSMSNMSTGTSVSTGTSLSTSSRPVSIASQRSYDSGPVQAPTAGTRQSTANGRMDAFSKGYGQSIASTSAQPSTQNMLSSNSSYLAPLQDQAPSLINSRTLPPLPPLGSPDSQASDNANAQPLRSQQAYWQNQGQNATVKAEPKASVVAQVQDWQGDSPSRRSRLDVKELAN